MTLIPDRSGAIECFFAPRRVAIVGASADPRKWGWMAAEQALRDAANVGREVLLVNARGGEILGQRCHVGVDSLPDDLDLAVITLPPAAFQPTIEALVAKRTRALVAITAGFGEAGEAGRAVEAHLVQLVRAAGSAMVGPNCMGVYDGLLPFRCMPWAEIAPGPVGFVSQSGGLIMDLSLRLAEVGLGVSRAVSIGNQADAGAAEFVRNLGAHAGTRVVAVYVESLGAGRALFEAIGRVVAAGKPVVVLTPDSNGAAARAARSHTASAVTQRRLVEAAARDAGAMVAHNLRDLTETLQGLCAVQPRPRGRRTFVVTDTGGPGVLLAGDVERAGLEMPLPSPALKARIQAALTPRAVVGNPIDLVDNLDVEPAVAVLQALIESGEADAVLMNLHAFVHDTPELEAEMGRRLAALATSAQLPVAVSCRNLAIPGARALVAGGVPVLRDGDAAARVLARWVLRGVAGAGHAERKVAPRGVPAMPTVAERVPGQPAWDIARTRAWLGEAGVPWPAQQRVAALEQAVEAARTIGWPVALKAVDRPHKSDLGGVALNLGNEAALASAWSAMHTRLPTDGLAVEAMARRESGVELLVGARHDEVLGPVLVLGMGGIHADWIDDHTAVLAPLTAADVDAALKRLRAAPMLAGVRGQAGIHVESVARVALALLALLHTRPGTRSVEINPLLVGPQDAVALDLRIEDSDD
jgi:acetate---CoA ligase (ADP-forming)